MAATANRATLGMESHHASLVETTMKVCMVRPAHARMVSLGGMMRPSVNIRHPVCHALPTHGPASTVSNPSLMAIIRCGMNIQKTETLAAPIILTGVNFQFQGAGAMLAFMRPRTKTRRRQIKDSCALRAR